MNLSKYLNTYKSILRLGIPILLGQIGIIVVGFVDTAMVGRYSTDALAAASFVNSLFALVIMVCLGFSFGLTPIVSSLFARKEHFKIGETVKNAVALNLLFALSVTILMLIVFFNVDKLGQPAHLLPLIRPYYLTVLVSVVFVALFNTLKQFSDGITHTSLAMWIIITGNIINIVFNYLLIFGKFGFPELGLLGAGLSTLGARIFMALFISIFLLISLRYKKFRGGIMVGKLNKTNIISVFHKSWPISLQMGLETGYFALSGIMIGWLGAIPLASYQIVMTLGSCGFMSYYSFAASMAIVASNHMGTNNVVMTKLAVKCGNHLIIALATAASILFLLAGRYIIMGFTTDELVISSALSLIPPMILYQYGDAIQILYSNALRSISHVIPMMWIAFVCYLIIGIPTTYAFGFAFKWGEAGIFYSYSVSLFLAALLYRLQFLKKINTLKGY